MGKSSKAVKEIKEKILFLEECIGNIEMDMLADKRRLEDYQSQREVLEQLLLSLEVPKLRKSEIKIIQ